MIEHDIRWSELEDLPSLEKWIPDEKACNPFPFGMEERSEALKNWIGFSRYKASLTATIGGVPCAIGTLFLMPYKKVSHHCSFYLIVAPEFRKQGIGFSMVRNLIHLAKTRFKLELIHAELFDCALRHTLDKLKFEEFAFQEHYVKIDGQVMPRTLMEHYIV
jgi:putative acetyltransferase